jgi:battenin
VINSRYATRGTRGAEADLLDDDQILPVCMAASYFLLLPRLSVFAAITQSFSSNDRAVSNAPYSALAATDDSEDAGPEDGDVMSPLVGADAAESDTEELLETRIQATLPSLTTREKIELAKPLFKRYMIPLFFVYLAGQSFSPSTRLSVSAPLLLT